MKTHAFLSITGQTFQIKLSIDEMTSYWAVSVSEKLSEAMFVIDQRFKGIGCSFALDLDKFFQEETSLISAMESTVAYLAKKLGLEIMRTDFVSK
jgi:hypothetical protein